MILKTLTLAAAISFSSAAFAQTTLSPETKQGLTGVVNQFYVALGDPVNDVAISAKLLADAQVELRDLGITQTGMEFVESLEEWQNVIKDGTIEHEIADVSDAVFEMNVCYRFAGGDPYGTVEVMTFTDDGRIATYLQEAREESC
jgi:hypothetical protein